VKQKINQINETILRRTVNLMMQSQGRPKRQKVTVAGAGGAAARKEFRVGSKIASNDR